MPAKTSIESVQIGQQIPPLEVKLDLIKLLRYSAATWNFYLLHLEKEFAQATGSPDVNVHAPFFGAVMATMLSGWTGAPAAIKKLKYSVNRMGFPGDTLTFKGEVCDTLTADSRDWKVCELEVLNQNGDLLAQGTATLGADGSTMTPASADAPSGGQAKAKLPVAKESGSLLSPDVLDMIGQETALPGRDFIDNSSIRRYARAVLDDSPHYLGPCGADDALVAPPTFIFDVCHDIDAATGEDGRALNRLTFPGLKAVRGGNEYWFGEAAVSGDRVDATRKIVDIYEKVGKSVGRILFVIYDTTFANQVGTKLGIARETMLFVQSL